MKRLGTSLALIAMLGTAHADGMRKRHVAQALSGVGTGVSGALFLSAFLFTPSNGDVNLPLMWTGLGTSILTPSLGEYYAGEYLTPGMGIRLGAAGLAAFAISAKRHDVRCASELAMTCTELDNTAVMLLGISAIMFAGGAAYDVLDAGNAAERWNAKHGFVLTPVLAPGSASLMLGGSF